MDQARHEVVIIGAGFCGLALGAALRRHGIDDFVILEQGDDVGHFWSTTYDRIHLHSPWHGLPEDGGLLRRFPMYKSGEQLRSYFRAYAERFDLRRQARFGARVVAARHDRAAPADAAWEVRTEHGAVRARILAVATALNRRPQLPALPEAQRFAGALLHSSAYRRAAPFAGQRVLVVGSGNSAAEIALDLAEHGAAAVSLWVRAPRHFVPLRRMTRLYRVFRLLGQFSEARVAAAHRMPYDSEPFWQAVRQRDRVIGRLSVDLSRFGIRKPALGPTEETFRHGRIPVYDVGAIAAIRDGRIRVIDGNQRPIVGFAATTVRLGSQDEPFDAVILATGFAPGLDEFVDDAQSLLAVGRWGLLLPITDGRCRSTVVPSAFFPGFEVTLNGGLSLGRWGWEVGERIAEALAAGGAASQP